MTKCGFEHRFGHKLGMKSKSQHIIKSQNLEATLPAIILICDIFHVSVLEQVTTKKGRVYENVTKYTKTLLLCYVRDVREIQVRKYLGQYSFRKGVKSWPLFGLGSAFLMWQQKHLGACIDSWPCWRQNSTLSQLVSPLIPSIHDSTVARKRFRSPPMVSTYNRANSSTLPNYDFRGTHRLGLFISIQLLLAVCLMPCMNDHLYDLSTHWKYLPL